MSFPEVQRLLHLMNVEMDQEYALQLFQVSLSGKGFQKPGKATFSVGQKYSGPIQHRSLLNLSYAPYHDARLDGRCRACFLPFGLLRKMIHGTPGWRSQLSI